MPKPGGPQQDGSSASEFRAPPVRIRGGSPSNDANQISASNGYRIPDSEVGCCRAGIPGARVPEIPEFRKFPEPPNFRNFWDFRPYGAAQVSRVEIPGAAGGRIVGTAASAPPETNVWA